MLAEAAAVLRYLCRTVHDLRWRSAMLAARARVAGYDVGPDATVQTIGLPLAVPVPGLPAPLQHVGPELPARSAAGAFAELQGRSLAAQPHRWRSVQLDVAGLLDDACTGYAAACAGLRRLAEDQQHASVAPPRPGAPDGGGYAIDPLAAATAGAQLPGTREDLWALLRRRAGRGVDLAGRRPPSAAAATALPAEVARVVADRRLGRATRMSLAARALDRIVAAAGQVPVIPVVASVPVGRIPPLKPAGVLTRMPIADVALAGWSVRQDVSHGYTVPEAIGREGSSTLGGYAAAQGAGYLVVIVGGPPVAAAIVAVGVGLLVGELAGALYDKVTHHAR